jgi:hypothetical protein
MSPRIIEIFERIPNIALRMEAYPNFGPWTLNFGPYYFIFPILPRLNGTEAFQPFENR